MNEMPSVFLDTDIGPDCDDTAALAILLQLCRERKARLLGITHCTGSPYGLAAIDAICRLFHWQGPIGTCEDKSFLSEGFALCYTPEIARRFPNRFPPEQSQPDALNVFIEALREAPDQSVTFVGIGPMKNIAHFLRDPKGYDLMHRKLSHMVLMAGCLNRTVAEWNVEMDIPSARFVVENWKGTIDFCPLEAMENVLTGACLRQTDTPVTTAYRLHTKGLMLRPSWDLETVIAAILGAEPPYEWSPYGNITIDEDGVMHFFIDKNGKHRYLCLKGSEKDAAEHIETQLKNAVQTMQKERKTQ